MKKRKMMNSFYFELNREFNKDFGKNANKCFEKENSTFILTTLIYAFIIILAGFFYAPNNVGLTLLILEVISILSVIFLVGKAILEKILSKVVKNRKERYGDLTEKMAQFLWCSNNEKIIPKKCINIRYNLDEKNGKYHLEFEKNSNFEAKLNSKEELEMETIKEELQLKCIEYAVKEEIFNSNDYKEEDLEILFLKLEKINNEIGGPKDYPMLYLENTQNKTREYVKKQRDKII